MKIKDKLRSFDKSSPCLHLFREGMFAKLYNESAYLFSKYVREYKVNVTDSKIGRYYSLGFPIMMLERLQEDIEGSVITEIEPGYNVCRSESFIFDDAGYHLWCTEADTQSDEASRRNVMIRHAGSAEAPPPPVPVGYSAPSLQPGATPVSASQPVPMAHGLSAGLSASDPAVCEILSSVLKFRIESSSPMECMFFLQNIQKKLYDTLPELAGI